MARTSLYFPGQTVGGRFRIEKMLGRGAVGSVLAAVDERTGGRVALKLLRSKAAGDAVTVERFRREAMILSRFDHPGVVGVEDAGALDDGTLYLAMELLEGRTLHQRLLHDGAMDVGLVSPVVAGLASALTAVHARGILHRDIKPSNVFLPDDAAIEAAARAGSAAEVKLVDFGIAKIPGLEGLTGTAVSVGTAAYMSPEQLRRPKEIDQRTDVYAVGVCLYEALTAERAFRTTDDLHVYEAILEGSYRRLRDLRPEVPASIEAVVARAMAPRMDDRHPTVAALAEAWSAASRP